MAKPWAKRLVGNLDRISPQDKWTLFAVFRTGFPPANDDARKMFGALTQMRNRLVHDKTKFIPVGEDGPEFKSAPELEMKVRENPVDVVKEVVLALHAVDSSTEIAWLSAPIREVDSFWDFAV